MLPFVPRLLARLTGAALVLAAVPAQADGVMENPLPRVEDRLCPGVAGLQQQPAEEMVARIRENAAKAGLRLAREDTCRPNLVVAFLEDGGHYLADLADRQGHLFRELDRSQREALLAQEGPARVWHQVSVRTRDGMAVGVRENPVNLPWAGMWQAHSRIYVPVRQDITHAMVLFDRDAVRGLSVAQLADYASMRALATHYPGGSASAGVSADTILALFDPAATAQGGAKPDALTRRDMVWLERLYAGIPNVPASVRLRGMGLSAGAEPSAAEPAGTGE